MQLAISSEERADYVNQIIGQRLAEVGGKYCFKINV